MSCDVCGNEPDVGVAAVPGVPMSISYGRECLSRGATPLWAAEVNFENECTSCFDGSTDRPDPDCAVCKGTGVAPFPEGFNPAEHLALWFLKEWTWLDESASRKYGLPVGYHLIEELFPPVPRWIRIVQEWRHMKMQDVFAASAAAAS